MLLMLIGLVFALAVVVDPGTPLVGQVVGGVIAVMLVGALVWRYVRHGGEW